MGRYILIEFDDNESAVKLKRQIDLATKKGKLFRVVGYFAKPDGPYCDCDVATWTFERGKPFSPTKHSRKTGWVKCLVCDRYREPGYFSNLLGVDKVARYLRKTIQHYKTKQPIEVVPHFLGISLTNMPVPGEDKE